MKTIFIIYGQNIKDTIKHADELQKDFGGEVVDFTSNEGIDLDKLYNKLEDVTETNQNIIAILNNEICNMISNIIEIAKAHGYKIQGECLDVNVTNYLTLKQGFHEINIYKDGNVVDRQTKVLIASTNMGKIEIYSKVLEDLGMLYTSLRDLKVGISPEENGKDEIENALIKARAYYKETNLPVLSNDSGLIIEKLPLSEQPGLFVRRYQGSELTDEQMIDIYSKKLEAVGGDSNAYFNVALAIVDRYGVEHTKLFKSPRYMVSMPSKIIQKGLPLRSLDFNKELNKYMSEMTIEEANASEGECLENQAEFIKSVLK